MTAKQIGIDSSGLSHLVELLQTIENLQEMPSLNVTPRMRAQVLLYNVFILHVDPMPGLYKSCQDGVLLLGTVYSMES